MTDEPEVTVPETTPAEAAPEVSERKRGPDGRFSATESEDATLDRIFAAATGAKPEPKKEQPSPKAEEKETPKTEKPVAPEYTKAMKALELDGFTSDDLAGMSEERILALGQKAQKRQSDIGKKLSERAKTEEPATATPKDPKPVGQVNFKELAKSMGDLLGDDVGDALASILEHSLSPIFQRLGTAEAELQARAIERLEGEADRARTKLGERFPALKDGDQWDKVQARMGVLAKTQAYEDVESLMRDACRLELDDSPVPAKQRNDTSRNNGQPTPVTRQKLPSAARTREEAEDLALDEALSKHRLG